MVECVNIQQLEYIWKLAFVPSDLPCEFFCDPQYCNEWLFFSLIEVTESLLHIGCVLDAKGEID